MTTAEEEYLDRQRKKSRLLSLGKSGDWRGVLDAYQEFGDGYREPLLVWVRPDAGMIRQITGQYIYVTDSRV